MSAGAPVSLYEVGPRDGLQNEAGAVPAATKVAFIEALAAAGLRWIEATSFVHPRWVPQLADAEEVFTAVRHLLDEGVHLPVLVPNLRGYARARAVGARDRALRGGQ